MATGQVNRFRGNPLVRRGLRAVATGLGAGRVPFAPGTAGTLVALPMWYLTGAKGPAHFLLLCAVLLVSIPAVREETESSGEKDPKRVVIDEIAGMLLAATGISWSPRNVLGLFLLFRFFDIVKFGPTAWMDRREGAAYVVADDLCAGVLAGLAWRGIAWLTA